MLNLPSKSEINKVLPKNLVFAKFQMKSVEQAKFNADIKQICLVNEVSSQNVQIDTGSEIKSFFVLHIALKKQKYDEQNIIKLSKLIPQNLLFVLDYEGLARLAVYRTRLITSEWQPLSELSVRLDGLNLDDVWQNIIKSLECGDYGVELDEWNDELTLDENLIAKEKRDNLKKQIAMLDKKSRREIQPRKKFEYRQQIKKLKEELFNSVEC